MSISDNYGPPADKTQGNKVIRSAYERGITFFDTAEVYGPYVNEELVGEARAPVRNKVAIATKFSFANRWHDRVGQPTGAYPEGRRGIVEASQDRPHRSLLPALGRSHRTDRRRGWHGQGSGQAGKVLHFGLSEASPKTIRRAHAVQPVSAIQTEYSLMERSPEHNGVLQTCEELGIGFVPWGPLGQGYLTGKLDARAKFDQKMDLRAGFPRFSPMVMKNNQPIIDFLKTFGAKKGATPAQIALAWLMAQKPWIVPIPGTRNMDHLNENLGAINVQLTPADLREIEVAFSRITIYGGRMDATQMSQIGQD